ncbi:hypothetical protein [Acinetobacter radioresistens]|uniref:hypothetical protein n=1 Tax=Acinetobacter radioresistens TaxID=40216 RepID=UPI001250BED0|nr:hypothetical protein [Acinetobacter radioresistens]
MLKLINETHPSYQLAKQFFKNFKDESLIWTAYSWIHKKNFSKREFLNLLNERHSFEAIASYLEKEFRDSTLEELNSFLEYCYKYEINFIPNEDLKFQTKDNRLCWFNIKSIKTKYSELKYTRYKFTNPYFSLLYLIQIELIEYRITLSDIREYKEILNNKGNFVHFLNTYINSADFIDWALKYTQKKYHLKTFPNFVPTNIDEQLHILLGYWDLLYIEDRKDYIIEISKLKKAWQQNVFRKKNEDNPKKKYHLPLRKEAKKFLEELALFKNISESEVLEILIKEAYKNEMCNEKGKAQY